MKNLNCITHIAFSVFHAAKIMTRDFAGRIIILKPIIYITNCYSTI